MFKNIGVAFALTPAARVYMNRFHRRCFILLNGLKCILTEPVKSRLIFAYLQLNLTICKILIKFNNMDDSLI